MGTNFYLRRVEPVRVETTYKMHFAKRSGGWVICFQDSTEGWCEPTVLGEPEPPEFRSVADIRALLESGRYQVADEYGDVWAPGAESLRMLSELCGWRGGPLFTGRPAPYTGSRDAPPGCPYTHGPGPSVYLDPEGYVFDTRWFR